LPSPSAREIQKLVPGNAAATLSATLFTGLHVVRMLFQLAEKTALLELEVKALQRTVNTFVGLDGNLNQIGTSSEIV